MAQIVVSSALSTVGNFVASTAAGEVIKSFGISSAIGQGFAGNLFGSATNFLTGNIANKLLGNKPKIRGSRLKELDVQSSTYGKAIARVYGKSRVAGNVIWARPIVEHVVSNNDGGGKGGGGSRASSAHYEYSCSLAIAICEGEIDSIGRVWADAGVIDPAEFTSSYRLYKGTEDQLPDPTIESFEGTDNTPAYRGLAYVVIEDFPLGDYGNRIPNFTFEVNRKLKPVDIDGMAVEDMIESMIMIPGSGEFVYDTIVQQKTSGYYVDGQWVASGEAERINQTNTDNKANALVALDQLQETCPNVNWVGLVATWFGNDVDAGACTIRPGVEYASGAFTQPDTWSVAGIGRSSAYLISQDAQGNPVYGGTPSDACILRYLDEMQSRGLNVMFYPMFFMDTENKPWRGRVTGSAADVADFFTKTNGYNDFILHYANLVKDKVDAFVIGSELIGLTSVNDGSNNFPAVDALVSLAAQVKTIVGSGVKVTYAADWSEYHHTDGGWYNLDPLWASPNIDFIGIDAYFPLTDAPQEEYDIQPMIDGWTSGEGYDWYYTDPERTIQAPLSAPFAWKNIAWWWENTHTNPDSNPTAWVPESKPIWFTEYGFPSVDGASNQPNVFYDPSSSESYFPRFSKGRVDNRAQRLGLAATEYVWQGSSMIEQKFVWTWDARPYPFWPNLNEIWADTGLWKTGHWVQGKLGVSGLAAIVLDICVTAGLSENQVDVSRLYGLVDGYVLAEQQTAAQALSALQAAFFFDAVESDGVITFIPRGGESLVTIDAEYLLVGRESNDSLNIFRAQETELPKKVDVSYINLSREYQVGNEHAQRQVTQSQEQTTILLPIVMESSYAKSIADISLYNAWTERTAYRFKLPVTYAYLEPTDVITVNDGSANHVMRLVQVNRAEGGEIDISAVAEDVSIYDSYAADDGSGQTEIVVPAGITDMELLDLPTLPGEDGGESYVRYALKGQQAGWRGAVIYRSDDGGNNYTQIASSSNQAIFGVAMNEIDPSHSQRFDRSSYVDVIVNGQLESVSESAVLNGANIALLGDEIIQFAQAILLENNVYRLSILLRGRLGTEYAISSHAEGDRFVLLDSRLVRSSGAANLIGLTRRYKPVTVGGTLDVTDSIEFTYQGRAFLPYAPVHVSAQRDGSGNIEISWIRRTRIGGHWRDLVDVPLSETQELYDVEILDGSTVVRSWQVTTVSATYSAAEQVTDFGSVQSSVDVRIYQISEIVGRGTPAQASI